MMKKPEPKTLSMMAIGTLIAGAALCYLPYSRLSRYDATIADLRAQVKNKPQVEKQLADAQSQLANDQQQLSHLEANVSSASYVPSLLMDLDKYGRSCGLSVTGVRPHPNNPQTGTKAISTKPYDELQIDVTANGTYGSLERFINGLAEFPKVVAAYTISAQPKDNHNSSNPAATAGLLTVTVTLNAYIFKQDSSAASPIANGPGPTVTTTQNSLPQAGVSSGTQMPTANSNGAASNPQNSSKVAPSARQKTIANPGTTMIQKSPDFIKGNRNVD